jgi:elongation factor Ts
VAEITTQMIRELRQQAGAGILDCKQALELHQGNFEEAMAYLREKGMVAAAKRAEREAREGLVGSYVHAGSRVAALVEVNCETDFVARTEEFQQLTHDLAMQVVALKPVYLAAGDVPASVVEEQKDLIRAELQGAGKPPTVVDQIVAGKLRKFYEENCLLEQAYIRDPSITIAELVQQKNAVLGENIVVRRFCRFEVGG